MFIPSPETVRAAVAAHHLHSQENPGATELEKLVAALSGAVPVSVKEALLVEADRADASALAYEEVSSNRSGQHGYEDIVRYGAYAAAARTTAHSLRTRANAIGAGQ